MTTTGLTSGEAIAVAGTASTDAIDLVGGTRVFAIVVQITAITETPTQITATGGGVTWELQATSPFDNTGLTRKRISLLSGLVPTNINDTIDFDCGGQAQTNIGWGIIEEDTLVEIIQSASDITGTGPGFSLDTFDPFRDTASRCLVGASVSAAAVPPAAPNPIQSLSEIFALDTNSDMSICVSTDNDNTPSFTGNSPPSGLVAVEMGVPLSSIISGNIRRRRRTFMFGGN